MTRLWKRKYTRSFARSVSDRQLLTSEIFGPILPIIPVDNVEEAINLIAEGPSPLVIYAFTNDEALQKRRELAEISYHITAELVRSDTRDQKRLSRHQRHLHPAASIRAAIRRIWRVRK